jgi:hypothetical protein
MPTIFDLLYRQYCRARLAEMRRQLLIRPESHEVSEANCDASHPNCAVDQGSSRLGDSQREARHRRLSSTDHFANTPAESGSGAAPSLLEFMAERMLHSR